MMLTRIHDIRLLVYDAGLLPYDRISEENFSMLMARTQTEQEEVKAHISLIRQDQQRLTQMDFDYAQWREAIRQYSDITALDAVTLNKLIRQIVVHEEISEDGTRKIAVEIHFNMRQPLK